MVPVISKINAEIVTFSPHASILSFKDQTSRNKYQLVCWYMQILFYKLTATVHVFMNILYFLPPKLSQLWTKLFDMSTDYGDD